MEKQIRQSIDLVEAHLRTVDDHYALPREGARFCYALAMVSRARRVIEIGTGYGYSTLWIAAALAETQSHSEFDQSKSKGSGSAASANHPHSGSTKIELITIDHEARKIAAARKWLDAAGLADLVRFETGHALEVLERIDGPIDFVLNDADKDHCQRYIELLSGKVRPQGVIVTDNVETHAVQLAAFLRWIRTHEDFFSTPVSVGNGMEVSVKT